jgi:CubicO group peptidase (beta-lactamase class C family)
MNIQTRREVVAMLGTLALPTLSGSAFAASAVSAEKRSVIDRLLSDQIAQGHVPGLSCAVGAAAAVIYAVGFGQRSVSPSAPITAASSCALGSVSKQFVSACCYLLQQDGKLSLDAPLADVLPDYVFAHRMTLHQVLTMRGGIPIDNEAGERPIDGRMDEQTLVENLNRASLDFTPGEHYAYSNCGYDIVGAVISRVAGVPYAQFLTDRILRPLGMNATSVLAAKPEGDFAQGYERHGNDWTFAPPTAADRVFASGNLVSTLADIQLWNQALLRGSLLSEASLKAMLSVPPLTSGAESNYASGWFVESNGVFWHGGTLAGYGTTNVVVPATGHSIVIFGNTGTSEHWAPTELARQIYNAADLGPALPPFVARILPTLPGLAP